MVKKWKKRLVSHPSTRLPSRRRGTAADPISALNAVDVVEVADGRHFQVRHGKLDTNGTPNGVWRIATNTVDTWLTTVDAHRWGTFRDIGKIRVGVKTCADKIFIRDDLARYAGDRPARASQATHNPPHRTSLQTPRGLNGQLRSFTRMWLFKGTVVQ
jgi:hypothetical protein